MTAPLPSPTTTNEVHDMADGDDFAFNDRVIREFREHDGVVGEPFEGASVVLLHTVGVRSGKPRVSPVVSVPHEGRPVFAASANGLPHHPGWYHNLRAMTALDVELATDTGVRAARARPEELTGTARDRAWAELVAVHPRFAGYAERTAGIRDIPVFALDLAPGA